MPSRLYSDRWLAIFDSRQRGWNNNIIAKWNHLEQSSVNCLLSYSYRMTGCETSHFGLVPPSRPPPRRARLRPDMTPMPLQCAQRPLCMATPDCLHLQATPFPLLASL
eukprot:4646574-Pyramimonas_sp.AAC.2